MAANEKFNNLIDEIEKQVTSQTKSARDIYFDVSRSQGLQPRDLSTVFSFLTNITLYEYVKNRKLMSAYNYLVGSQEPNVSQAIEIADYSDQPSFIKAFKKMFDCTPREAVIRKDFSKITPPLSWDMLSSDFASVFYDKEPEKLQEKTFFGISESSFTKLSRALDLEAFYGLSKMFSSYAFELAEKTGRSLDETFAYVVSLQKYGRDFTDDPDGLTPEESLKEAGDNPVFQNVFFNTKIDVSIISELMLYYGASEEDLLSCTAEMLNLYPGYETGVEMSFPYYVRAYKYYEERMPLDLDDYYWFNSYLDRVMTGCSFKEAYDEVYPFAACAYDIETDEILKIEERIDEEVKVIINNYDYDLDYSVADELEDEQERWRGIRIDEDYDADNAGFEELDKEDSERFN